MNANQVFNTEPFAPVPVPAGQLATFQVSIPEPAALSSLLLIGGATVTRRRRK